MLAEPCTFGVNVYSGSCEHGNELSGSIQGGSGQFLDWLSGVCTLWKYTTMCSEDSANWAAQFYL